MKPWVLQASFLLVLLLVGGCAAPSEGAGPQATGFVKGGEYSLGETARVNNDLEVTVLGVQYWGCDWQPCTSVNIRVKNIGSQLESPSPVNPVIVDGNGQQYNQFGGKFSEAKPKIYPGVQTEYSIAFNPVNASAGGAKIYLPFGSTTLIYDAKLPEVVKKLNVTITDFSASMGTVSTSLNYVFTLQNTGSWPINPTINASLSTNGTVIDQRSLSPLWLPILPGESQNFSWPFFLTFEYIHPPGSDKWVLKPATYTVNIQVTEKGGNTVIGEATKTLDVGEDTGLLT